MIRFDVLFKNNQVADCEAACFGWLAKVNDLWYRQSKIQTGDNNHLAADFTHGREAAQELVWYVNHSITTGDKVEIWGIVKDIVQEFPWLNDTVLLRPETGTVHVKLGDNPCDKSILCIGIIRNYFMVPSFPQSYKKARSLGASVKEAYFFAALVEYTTDWRNNWSCVTRALWEYDAVNSGTFGKAALKAMLSPDYSPWKQGNWLENAGYDREHTMQEDFFDLNGIPRRRKLLDTFSIERDEEIIREQEQIQVRDDAGVIDIINQIRQAIEA